MNWSKDLDVTPKILWLNDGQLRLQVGHIPSSLAPTVDVRGALNLIVNQEPTVCYQGQTPGVTQGFVLDAAKRAALLEREPASASIIHPFLGGKEMLERLVIDKWVIDIPHEDLLAVEATTPNVLEHLRRHVLPEREKAAKEEAQRVARVLAANPKARPNRHHAAFLAQWWRLGYRRKEMLDALAGLHRYIATSRVASENRASVFDFIDAAVHPGDSLTVFALDDDYSFGVLSSAPHRAWLQARCSTLETRLRYTSTTVWDTFPWPQAPSHTQVKAVIDVTVALLDLRQQHLKAGMSLKRQYNALRAPGKSKLRDLHLELDSAVFAAYGFSHTDDLITQMLALNQHIALDATNAHGPGSAGLGNPRVSNYRRASPL